MVGDVMHVVHVMHMVHNFFRFLAKKLKIARWLVGSGRLCWFHIIADILQFFYQSQ